MRERRKRAETLIRIQQERVPHLIVGGLDVESEGNATIAVVNPTDGQPIGRCPAANQRDVEKAVKAAKKAFEDGWGQTAPRERAELMLALADVIDHEAEDLAILESLQTGRTFRDVLQYEIRSASQVLRYYAGWAGRLTGDVLELGQGNLGFSRWEPHPVVGAVLPNGDGFAAAVRKSAPALAAGASLVLKAPEVSPLTVLRFAELAREHGFPHGVLNVLTGHAQTAEHLAQNNDVGVLWYAGPMEQARRAVLAAAKSNLKPIHLELGGNTATLLFEDADHRRATQWVVKSIFGSRATQPMAAARLLVHESLYAEVTSAVTGRAREVVLGDPLDEHTELGPMPTEEHLRRVLAYVELGRREGAKIVAGGTRETDGARADGWFMKPTVMMDVRATMRVAREDIGGPVLVLIPFRNEDEALAIANDTNFALAASVWTKDFARAQRVNRRLDAGVVWHNQLDLRDPALPSTGRNLAGLGADLGPEPIKLCCRPKTTYLSSR